MAPLIYSLDRAGTFVFALSGGLYVGLDALGAGTWLAAGIAFTACTGLRLAAIRWNLSLPPYRT